MWWEAQSARPRSSRRHAVLRPRASLPDPRRPADRERDPSGPSAYTPAAEPTAHRPPPFAGAGRERRRCADRLLRLPAGDLEHSPGRSPRVRLGCLGELGQGTAGKFVPHQQLRAFDGAGDHNTRSYDAAHAEWRAEGHTRSRSTQNGSTDTTASSKARDRSAKGPSQKAMLSKALQKANSAVEYDNVPETLRARGPHTRSVRITPPGFAADFRARRIARNLRPSPSPPAPQLPPVSLQAGRASPPTPPLPPGNPIVLLYRSLPIAAKPIQAESMSLTISPGSVTRNKKPYPRRPTSIEQDDVPDLRRATMRMSESGCGRCRENSTMAEESRKLRLAYSAQVGVRGINSRPAPGPTAERQPEMQSLDARNRISSLQSSFSRAARKRETI